MGEILTFLMLPVTLSILTFTLAKAWHRSHNYGWGISALLIGQWAVYRWYWAVPYLWGLHWSEWGHDWFIDTCVFAMGATAGWLIWYLYRRHL